MLWQDSAGSPTQVQYRPFGVRQISSFGRGFLSKPREIRICCTLRVISAAQIEFLNLIVDQLTERGVMSAELLYESPFTDINPQGPEGVFAPAQVDDLLQLLAEVRKRAAA